MQNIIAAALTPIFIVGQIGRFFVRLIWNFISLCIPLLMFYQYTGRLDIMTAMFQTPPNIINPTTTDVQYISIVLLLSVAASIYSPFKGVQPTKPSNSKGCGYEKNT